MGKGIENETFNEESPQKEKQVHLNSFREISLSREADLNKDSTTNKKIEQMNHDSEEKPQPETKWLTSKRRIYKNLLGTYIVVLNNAT